MGPYSPIRTVEAKGVPGFVWNKACLCPLVVVARSRGFEAIDNDSTAKDFSEATGLSEEDCENIVRAADCETVLDRDEEVPLHDTVLRRKLLEAVGLSP